jgi:hypothetical protein
MHVYDELLDRGASSPAAYPIDPSHEGSVPKKNCFDRRYVTVICSSEATGNFTNPSKTHQMVWTLKNCGRHADRRSQILKIIADYNLLYIGYLKQLDGNGSLDSHSCV